MSKVPLNNLERARLLDILLWCGDLVGSLGPKKTSSTSTPPAGRGRYEKPSFRHEIPSTRIREISVNPRVRLRFLVASKKSRIISGKSYKAGEETTASDKNAVFLKITKQAA